MCEKENGPKPDHDDPVTTGIRQETGAIFEGIEADGGFLKRPKPQKPDAPASFDQSGSDGQ